MITLTEKAVKHLKEISDGEGIGHYTVRVKVIGSGCMGMTHDMMFDDQIQELDEVIEQGDIKIIVDALSWQYVENAIIDYEDTLFGGSFKFGGSDIKKTCGCGRSVAY